MARYWWVLLVATVLTVPAADGKRASVPPVLRRAMAGHPCFVVFARGDDTEAYLSEKAFLAAPGATAQLRRVGIAEVDVFYELPGRGPGCALSIPQEVGIRSYYHIAPGDFYIICLDRRGAVVGLSARAISAGLILRMYAHPPVNIPQAQRR